MTISQINHALSSGQRGGRENILYVNLQGSKDGTDSDSLAQIKSIFGGHLYQESQVLALELPLGRKRSGASQKAAISFLQKEMGEKLPDIVIGNWQSLLEQGPKVEMNVQ